MSFKIKEGTHIVLKKDDLKYLEQDKVEVFIKCLREINSGRVSEDKNINNYYVVNLDEPYAPEVFNVIKRGEIFKEELENGNKGLLSVVRNLDTHLKYSCFGELAYQNLREKLIVPLENYIRALKTSDKEEVEKEIPTEEEVCSMLSGKLGVDVKFFHGHFIREDDLDYVIYSEGEEGFKVLYSLDVFEYDMVVKFYKDLWGY